MCAHPYFPPQFFQPSLAFVAVALRACDPGDRAMMDYASACADLDELTADIGKAKPVFSGPSVVQSRVACHKEW